MRGRQAVRDVLERVSAGTLDVEAALETIATAPVTELGFAHVDVQRAVRTGVPEVVYGSGKTAPQLAAIVTSLLDRDQDALATRVDAPKAERVLAELARQGVTGATYHPSAQVLVVRARPATDGVGLVGVVSAGTSDQAVAEEAAVVAEALGANVLRIDDVGIAGVHRILGRLEDLRRCKVIVVVAGMDGALPGLVAGLVTVPVIATPTSVGYGASFGGIAALLTMLNACAPGVSVVNIDNGFGAAYQAALINRAAVGAT
jgi:NCAIR mutase (PurE)-related protein